MAEFSFPVPSFAHATSWGHGRMEGASFGRFLRVCACSISSQPIGSLFKVSYSSWNRPITLIEALEINDTHYSLNISVATERTLNTSLSSLTKNKIPPNLPKAFPEVSSFDTETLINMRYITAIATIMLYVGALAAPLGKTLPT